MSKHKSTSPAGAAVIALSLWTFAAAPAAHQPTPMPPTPAEQQANLRRLLADKGPPADQAEVAKWYCQRLGRCPPHAPAASAPAASAPAAHQ
jgi:hypothetical protein